jgi:hypothetical protein
MNEDYAKEHGYGRGDLVPWQMPKGNQALRVVGTYEANGAMFATCRDPTSPRSPPPASRPRTTWSS